MAPEPPSPSASTVLLPFLGGAKSRRGSLASISSRTVVDKDILSQALDTIHTTASKSETLTSFHDYDGGSGRAGPKEIVSSGVSGLYNRLRQSVTGNAVGKDARQTSRSRDSGDQIETRSLKSSTSTSHAKSGLSMRTPASDTASLRDASAAPSPVASFSNIERDTALSKATSRKSQTADSKSWATPEPHGVTSTSRRSTPPDQSQSSIVAESLLNNHRGADQDQTGAIRNASEREGTVNQLLPSFLPDVENPRSDSTQQSLKPSLKLDTGEAIDESDYADDDIEPVHPSQVLASNLATNSGSLSTRDDNPPLRVTSQRPPLVHVGVSHLPSFTPSRASSFVDTGEATSLSSAQASAHIPTLEPAPNLNTMFGRRHQSLRAASSAAAHSSVSAHLQRKILRKEFWMRDENARVCFACGQSFSTFRRKHHCRTCGQIFDAKCTSLVPGKPFGQPGTIRLCKPCEKMILDSDEDDSSAFTEDDDHNRSPVGQFISDDDNDDMQSMIDGFSRPGTAVTTPSIGIPVSRRNREAKRRSAIIEFDTQPTLARPSSSHSLISLSRRPRSSSHRRRHSRHTSTRGLRPSLDERGPFSQHTHGDPEKKSSLPVFHNDNVIDPDLAAFLSDEGTDDDDQPNIMATMEGGNGVSPGDRERFGFSGLFASALRKGRSRPGDKANSSIRGVRDDDVAQTLVARSPKNHRPRNLSNSSVTNGRPSPRRSRSALQFASWSEDQTDNKPAASLAVPPLAISKAICSSTIQSQGRPRNELLVASQNHARKLLGQLLQDAQTPSAAAWEKALMPIILQCADDVNPDVQHGDDMDIRQYIKLKKVPGGRPADTSYVSGVVFSKNVALRTMARSLSYPRIAIVTFAIEYARHEAHFMSLDPVIHQEREYLENLVGRIAALQPTVLLVQRHVSGLALQLLEKAGITVVCNIKQSVLAAVARVTETMLIKSIDKLGIDPSHLGRCDSFEVKTFVGEGSRKTYIYLSGCDPELGCTVVLRGADTKTLRNVKRVAEFMCYVAYNLKLESYLMRDQFISIPITSDVSLKAHDLGDNAKSIPMDALNEALKSAREASQVDVDGDENETQFKYAHFEASIRNRVLSASPFVVFMQPFVLTHLRDLERRLAGFKTLRNLYAAADEEGEPEEDALHRHFELVQPDSVNVPPSKEQPKAVREFLHAVHEAQLEKAMYSFETSEKHWESFIDGEVNPFDPFSHQKIVVLYSIISNVTSAPCTGPELIGIGFYSGYSRGEMHLEDDVSLGQYIEDLCYDANSTCRDCTKKNSDHHRQYVHGYGQLDVSITRQPTKMRGYHNRISMWSVCQKCAHETTPTLMSDETWKYSFAKFLELSFWCSPLHTRDGTCRHDIHRDYIRFFAFQELVVTFKYDAIDIYDVVVPRSHVTWKVESDLNVKNQQFSRFVQRLDTFTASVKKRLDSINVDTLDEKKSSEAYEYIQELRQRADDDHEEVLLKLRQKYATSRYYELIPFNRALRLMDEKAIAWDDIFNDFERDYFPSETDIRRLATLQLRNMFLESQPAPNSPSSETSDTEDASEAKSIHDEKAHNMPKQEEYLSEKAHDVLSSVVEDIKASVDDTEILTAEERKENDIPIDSDSARPLSPRADQVQIVEREDVRHLDLAIPSRSPEDLSPSQTAVENGSPDRAKALAPEPRTSPVPFATQPKPLSTGLLERIEQIRNTRAEGNTENDLGESKIPRLADLKKRDFVVPKPPPLLRARSSPNRVTAPAVDWSGEESIDSITGGPIDTESSQQDKKLGERLGVSRLATKVGKLAPSLIPRSIPKAEAKIVSSVSALARHFEQMSREFERERLRERRQRAMRSRQSRANPLASSRPVVEVYENATDAVGEKASDEANQTHEKHGDQPDGQNTSDATVSTQPKNDEPQKEREEEHEPEHETADPMIETDAEEDTSDVETSITQSGHPSDLVSGSSSTVLTSPTSVPDIADLSPELNIPEHRKNVWFKYLAEFWSKRSASGWSNLEYPLHANEHVFEDSDIIVRDDEPSSVIALSLSCTDYQNKLRSFRNNPSRQFHPKSSSFEKLKQQQQHGHPKDPNDILASLLSCTATHTKYSFTHGQVRASCKIFYPESFDALRRKCGVADRFIESMSRCLKFDSKGGKTKSLFLKTLDDRFIIKSLQEVELKAFTRFAPEYFDFMSWTLFQGVPSVIAKMFGLFQVSIRNPATGVDFSYYLLVMENLFYERSPDRRFDLKGSMRNRKIESTGQADEVLLDENLVDTIYEKPLFMREQSCRLFLASVFNDTLWLCKQNVMDYSLMAGFDDSRKELMVGIIDCIRTYTWDKKLESWIKDRGKNRPTITSPKDYRNRFRMSMKQYVLQAPSCWHQFQAQMAAPKKLKDMDREEEKGEVGYMDDEKREHARSMFS